MQCDANKENFLFKLLEKRDTLTNNKIMEIAGKILSADFRKVQELYNIVNNKDRLLDILKKNGLDKFIDTEHTGYVFIPQSTFEENNYNSSNTGELFRFIPGGMNYFTNFANRKVIDSILIGNRNNVLYPDDVKSLNHNLIDLKNSLYKDVVDYLIDHGKLNKEDYYTQDKLGRETFDNLLDYRNTKNYKKYKVVLSEFEKYFNDTFNGKEYNKKTIPEIKMSSQISNGRKDIDAYCSNVLLQNFDTILLNKYHDLVGVNKIGIGSLMLPNGEHKYTKRINGLHTEYWLDDGASSQGVENVADHLTSKLVSCIPQLDARGNSTGRYMSMSDLYGLGSAIYKYELENINEFVKDPNWKPFDDDPVKSLEKYISSVKMNDDLNVKNSMSMFRYKVDTLMSLKSFLDGIENKEARNDNPIKKLLSATISNTMGAIYSTDNAGENQGITYQDASSTNFERISLQQSMYNHYLNTLDNMDQYESINEGFKSNSIDPNDNLNSYIKKSVKALVGISLNNNNIGELKRLWGSYMGKELTNKNVNIPLRIISNAIVRKYGNEYTLFNNILKLENLDRRGNSNEINSAISSVSKLREVQAILDSKLFGADIRTVTTIKSFSGSSMPTCILKSLGKNDVSALYERAKIENESNGDYKNFFLKHNVLKGTSVKMEVVNGDNSKDASDLNVLENFISHFQYGFLNLYDNGVDLLSNNSDANTFNFQAGNYSDKSMILDKMVSPLYVDENGVEHNLLKCDLSEIYDMHYNQTKNWYSDLINNILPKYESLFGIKLDGSIKNKIDTVNEYLSNFNKQQFYNLIRGNGKFMEELDYSVYGNKIKLNQNICDYVVLTSNRPLFNKFIEQQKDSLLQKLYKYNGFKEELPIDKIESISEYYDSNGNMHIFSKKGNSISLNPMIERWFILNDFFRSEYLNATVKQEYMHPAKKSFREKKYSEINDNDLLNNMFDEASVRLAMQAKRNVGLTGTTQIPVKESKGGVPNKLNIAIIEDFNDLLYNYTGDLNNFDIHDGASLIPYAYSKMLDESYPGKGYDGLKKELGTLIDGFGSSLKKDAESIIDNARILDSQNSTIKLIDKQRQIYSMPITLSKSLKVNLGNNNIFFKDGEYNRIQYYRTDTDGLHMQLDKWNGNEWVSNPTETIVPVKNLFDVWTAFGAQYSMSNDFKLSEGSNELLYKFITDNGFKDKMIHVISNKSTFKSGSTNVNAQEFWNKPLEFSEDGSLITTLNYNTYVNKNIGVQLSPTHDVNGESIREVTQLNSALSQNPETSYIADDVYNMISRQIQMSMNKSNGGLFNSDQPNREELYNQVVKELSSQLSRANDNASISINDIMGKTLPISDPNIFRSLIKSSISNMNDNFIIRRYSGTGGTLSPSHKIIQVYEDENGNVFTQSDLIERIINDGGSGNTESLIQDGLNKYLGKSVQKPIDAMQIGDSFKLNGVTYSIDGLQKYYEYKRAFKGSTVEQIFNIPRDLKPTQITWNSNDGTIKNLFDLDSVRLLYNHKFNVTTDENDTQLLNKFIDKFGLRNQDGSIDEKNLVNKLNIWTQRGMSFISMKKELQPITLENFDSYFGNDKLNESYIYNKENDYVTKPIDGYSEKSNECVLGNVYKDQYGDVNMADAQLDGAGYFQKVISDLYKPDDTPNTDLKIVLADGQPVYITFGDSNKSQYNVKSFIDNDNNRIGLDGEKVYTVPKGSIFTNNGVADNIFIPISNKSGLYSRDNILKTLNVLLRSFDKSSIKAIVRINNISHPSSEEAIMCSGLRDTIFSNFTGFKGTDEEFINYQSKKMFASWQKSREFVTARIPAQSMQSFMKMTNVGYHRSKFNDTYVSVWQPFIQGSDFDVDKGYFIGAGINKSGIYETGNDAFDFNDKNDIDVIESMRLPNGKQVGFNENGTDLTIQYNRWANAVKENNYNEQLKAFKDVFDILGKTKSDYIKPVENEDFLNIINKYNTGSRFLSTKYGASNNIYSSIKKSISDPANQVYANKPVDTSDFDIGADKQNKLQYDALVANMSSIPNNELPNISKSKLENLFGIIITKKIGQGGLKNTSELKEEALRLYHLQNTISPHDGISTYKQQMDAIVGKKDVGIAANGNKSFLALTNYYNEYNAGKPDYENDRNKLFIKKLFINGKEVVKSTVADTNTPPLVLEQFHRLGINPSITNDGMAAQYISEFISGATDNAKLLLMSKIQATPELAAMHVYMMTLGFTAGEIAEYMNKPIAKYVYDQLASSNIYDGSKKYIDTILSDYNKINSHADREVETFRDIYQGGQELSTLSNIFGVNRKMPADMPNLFLFLNRFNQAIWNRESEVYNGTKNRVKDLSRNSGVSEDEVSKILAECSNIKVYYNDEHGALQTKNVSLINGNFDFRFYIHPNNIEYREKTRQYYNLLKNTFNIFDVIENSPSYKSMIDSVGYTHRLLSTVSSKYNFIFNTANDILRSNQKIFENNKSYKHYRGNKELPLNYNENIIRRLSNGFDRIVISSWGKTLDGFKLDVGDLLNKYYKSSGIDQKISLYTDDRAKLENRNFDKSTYHTIVDRNTKGAIIDLSTDYGIANFKMVMEKVITPLLQSDDIDFANRLRMKTVRNSNGIFSNQIVIGDGVNRLNNDFAINKFQEILSEFDDIDRSSKTKLSFVDGTNASYKDLYWIYNLVVNNEGFGDNRLTPIFEDQLKDSNFIAYKYLSYYSSIDKGLVDIFPTKSPDFDQLSKEQQDKSMTELGESLNKSVGFMALSSNGKLQNPSLSIQNPDFVVNSLFNENTSFSNYDKFKKVMSSIGSYNLPIDLICE